MAVLPVPEDSGPQPGIKSTAAHRTAERRRHRRRLLPDELLLFLLLSQFAFQFAFLFVFIFVLLVKEGVRILFTGRYDIRERILFCFFSGCARLVRGLIPPILPVPLYFIRRKREILRYRSRESFLFGIISHETK